MISSGDVWQRQAAQLRPRLHVGSLIEMELEIRTTTKTREEAQTIAREAVSRRMCACAHIDEIESFYTWEGQMETGTEYRLTLKSTDAVFPRVADLIRELHSYDEPAIYCFSIDDGSRSYLKWIDDNSR